MNSFTEGKHYVMSGTGEKWSDFDGPFDTQEDAITYLKQFINEDRTFSPEMLRMLVVEFKNGMLHMVKVDGHPLNGEYLYWKLGSN